MASAPGSNFVIGTLSHEDIDLCPMRICKTPERCCSVTTFWLPPVPASSNTDKRQFRIRHLTLDSIGLSQPMQSPHGPHRAPYHPTPPNCLSARYIICSFHTKSH
jgi:hypothetical protein